MSSSAHFVRSPLAFGDMEDLNLSGREGDRHAYYPWTAYGQSKLAQARSHVLSCFGFFANRTA